MTATDGAPSLDCIYIAKGIGISLVVIGHFSVFPAPSPDYWDALTRLIYSFHMPLFFVLSGYLHSHLKYSYLTLLENKVKRLLYPFLSIALLFFLAKYIAGMHVQLQNPTGLDSIQALITNPVHSYAPGLWFVHALFIIFALYPPARSLLDNLALLALLVILNSATRVTDVPLIGNALAYMPFFIVGVLLKENAKLSESVIAGGPKLFVPTLVAFAATYIWFFSAKGGDPLYVVRLFVGVCGSLLVINVSQQIAVARPSMIARVMLDMGYYSMTIYLFHTLFESTVRVGAHQLSGYVALPFEVVAIIAVASGIALPMLLEKELLRRYSLTRKFILGLTT